MIDLSSRVSLVEQISGTDGVRVPLVPTECAATATTKCPAPSNQKDQKEDQEDRWEDHEK